MSDSFFEKQRLMEGLQDAYYLRVSQAVTDKREQWEESTEQAIPLTMKEMYLRGNLRDLLPKVETKLRKYFDFKSHFVGSQVQQRTQ